MKALVRLNGWGCPLGPHSAEGLTEKRISGKVQEKAEGRSSVTGSHVPNGKAGSFGDRGRGVSGSRSSRVAGYAGRRQPTKRECRQSHGGDGAQWAWVQ